jgi:hypothetical protein
MNERVQRRIVNFIGAAVALCFLGYFVGIPLMIGFAMVSAERRDCEQMTTLAKDAAKVEYLKRWTESTIADPAFMEEFGMFGGDFQYPGDPEKFRKYQLDLQSVGIDPGRVGLYLKRKKYEDYRDPANVRWAMFQIRNADLAIKIGEATDTSLREPASNEEVTVINDQVSVWCRTH